MEFHVKVSFIHKKSTETPIIARDGFTAVQMVLNGLGSVEKDNIKGVNITYMELNHKRNKRW